MFLCCGDSLYDLFVKNSPNDNSDSNAVSISGTVGGSPLNVAIGLSRLGHQSRFFTKLSSDLFGQRVRAYLNHNQVDYSLSIDTDLNTTLAMVETDSAGAANYGFYTDNTADVSLGVDEVPDVLPDDICVIHLSSYSTVVKPTAKSLAMLAERESSNRLISYDLNLRLFVEPDVDRWREAFRTISSIASIIKASDEDIESLYGKNKEDLFVADCFDNGAELVFITRGPKGSSGFDRHRRIEHYNGIQLNVVDTVGAGDTFHAAILHWLATEMHLLGGRSLRGAVDLKACMAFATRAAADTCTRKGADLPYLDDL